MKDGKRKKVVAVVLAAGEARRMGRPKQLLPWADTTILGQTLANVLASRVDELILISGAYRREVEETAAVAGVPVLFNANYAAGEMISSLKLAVRTLVARPDPPDAVLVVLADLPTIGPEIIDAVLNEFQAHPQALVAPYHAGRRGHPVLIGRQLFDELLKLPAGSAPRELFKRHPDKITRLVVESDAIHQDIDTPQQYREHKP